jgi:hypothetical protein
MYGTIQGLTIGFLPLKGTPMEKDQGKAMGFTKEGDSSGLFTHFPDTRHESRNTNSGIFNRDPCVFWIVFLQRGKGYFQEKGNHHY